MTLLPDAIDDVSNEREQHRLTGAAPLNPEISDDPVVLGRAAWERLKSAARNSWPNWKDVGHGLKELRALAMRTANADRPRGKRYNQMFGNFLQVHGFDEIDPADRAKLLQIMDQLPELEAFIASKYARGQLNHPSAVWRAWKCPDRGGKFREEQGIEPQPRGVSASAERVEESDNEARLQRELLIEVNKIAGKADDFLNFEGEVDEALVAAVRAAADAWAQTAVDFERRLRRQQPSVVPSEMEPA